VWIGCGCLSYVGHNFWHENQGDLTYGLIDIDCPSLGLQVDFTNLQIDCNFEAVQGQVDKKLTKHFRGQLQLV